MGECPHARGRARRFRCAAAREVVEKGAIEQGAVRCRQLCPRRSLRRPPPARTGDGRRCRDHAPAGATLQAGCGGSARHAGAFGGQLDGVDVGDPAMRVGVRRRRADRARSARCGEENVGEVRGVRPARRAPAGCTTHFDAGRLAQRSRPKGVVELGVSEVRRGSQVRSCPAAGRRLVCDSSCSAMSGGVDQEPSSGRAPWMASRRAGVGRRGSGVPRCSRAHSSTEANRRLLLFRGCAAARRNAYFVLRA